MNCVGVVCDTRDAEAELPTTSEAALSRAAGTSPLPTLVAAPLVMRVQSCSHAYWYRCRAFCAPELAPPADVFAHVLMLLTVVEGADLSATVRVQADVQSRVCKETNLRSGPPTAPSQESLLSLDVCFMCVIRRNIFAVQKSLESDALEFACWTSVHQSEKSWAANGLW